MWYSRPVFRTSDIVCNHAARMIDRGRPLSSGACANKLAQLEHRRKKLQRVLDRVGAHHGHVCAECKGECCGGVRERDAFLDRVMQCPTTKVRSARNLASLDACHQEGHGSCPELTTQGCRIPYELRPIQCTAYFCWPATNAIPEKPLSVGTKALAGLVLLQVQTVIAAIRGK
jgi:hypothetical protein